MVTRKYAAGLHSYLNDQPPAEFEATFLRCPTERPTPWSKSNSPSPRQNQGDSVAERESCWVAVPAVALHSGVMFDHLVAQRVVVNPMVLGCSRFDEAADRHKPIVNSARSGDRVESYDTRGMDIVIVNVALSPALNVAGRFLVKSPRGNQAVALTNSASCRAELLPTGRTPEALITPETVMRRSGLGVLRALVVSLSP
jgi:hypothetical protein